MHRSRWRRLLTTVCSLWLLVMLVEPAALHSCAMHGQHSDRSHVGTATHAGHDHAGHPSGTRRDRSCTCLGTCCAAVVAVTPAAPPVLTLTVLAPPTGVRKPTAISYRPAAIAWARPPTIGPPHHTA